MAYDPSRPKNAGETSVPVFIADFGNRAVEEEARKDPRHGCDVATWFHSAANGAKKVWCADVKNISASGLAMLSERRFEPGTVLVIAPMEQPEGSGGLLGRVVRLRPHASGQWVIGCQLVEPLGEDEIRDVLGAGKPAYRTPTIP